MKTALALIAALMADQAHADVVTFQGDNDVVFTRCTDAVFQTVCEMIFPQGTMYGSYVCVAMNIQGDPIAAVEAPTFMFESAAWFQGLPAMQIDDVKCRRR